MSADVSSRILAAATLAEQAAKATQTGDRWTAYVRDRDVHIDGGGHVALIGRETWPEVWPQARLIVASGPSHWGAVAKGLRSLLELHRPEMHTKHNVPCFDEFDSPTVVYRRCAGCHTRLFPAQSEANGCPSLAALLPLVNQITRDLGDGQNG